MTRTGLDNHRNPVTATHRPSGEPRFALIDARMGDESYRGEQLGDVVVWMGKFLPDVHRELHRVNVLGDVVAIEVSIRGTFLGPFETPAGVIQPTGAKVEFPTADFWYLRNGKVEVFDCHIAFTTLFAQLGILPDYASAVAASAPKR